MRSVPGSRPVTTGGLACVHVAAPSTAPVAPRSFARPGSRCCRPVDPGRTSATAGSSGVWPAWPALLRGRHAIAPCGPCTLGRRRAWLHCAEARARSSMPIYRADAQSPEHLRRERVPARSVRAQKRKGIGLLALARTGQDSMEAYRHIVGTIGCRRPVTRQQCQPRPRWCALVQSPSRTAIALRDATLEVDPASAASRAAIDPPSTSLLSSTPPIWKCCGDQLNPPRQMLTRRKCQFTNSQIAVGGISTDIGMFRLSDTPSPSEETASASRYPPPHGLGMFARHAGEGARCRRQQFETFGM